MYLYDKHTREDNTRAIELAQQAIEIDPGYAPAYALLSSSYFKFGSFVGIPAIPASEARAKALAAAMKALEIDDTLAEAHLALGLILEFEHWDWAGAEREFKRAIELNPNSALAHQEYANYLGYFTVKDPDAAIREAKRAQELDPLSFWGNVTVGPALCKRRQVRQSVGRIPEVAQDVSAQWHLALANRYRSSPKWKVR